MHDGVRIAHATSGAGYPLVKAPNWMNHVEFDWESPIWRHVFRALSRDNLLVRFDQRGNGLSDWDVDDLSFEARVQDLADVVDALGLERFALLGISQGGSTAVEYVSRHPERASHLILVGAFARGWGRQGSEKTVEVREAMITLMESGWGQDNPAFRQMWTTRFVPEGTVEQHRWFNELQRMTTSPENAANVQRANRDIDVRSRLPHLRVPTLVLHARDDAIVPYSEGQDYASLIRGARFVTLDSKNHLLLEEEPAFRVFIKQVRTFLAHPCDESDAELAPAAVRPRGLRDGTRLGHYEIESPIGAGSMGTVYRATDLTLQRAVAIKVLTETGDASASARPKLLREARHVAALNHPNICTIHEISQADEQDFIVMELVAGRPLDRLLADGGLPFEQVVSYGRQIAAALSHAHGRGIVHRDLKSANILVSDDGGVKILDFGLARRFAAPDAATLTASAMSFETQGAIVGTLAYMAPEALHGEPVAARGDVWSLGVILYEMTTGRRPFSGQSGFDVISAILRDEPARPDAQVKPGLWALIRRCLDKRPDARVQAASEVFATLDEIAAR